MVLNHLLNGIILQILQALVSGKVCDVYIATVDWTNPAPPGMYKTLWILEYLFLQLVSQISSINSSAWKVTGTQKECGLLTIIFQGRIVKLPGIVVAKDLWDFGQTFPGKSSSKISPYQDLMPIIPIARRNKKKHNFWDFPVNRSMETNLERYISYTTNMNDKISTDLESETLKESNQRAAIQVFRDDTKDFFLRQYGRNTTPNLKKLFGKEFHRISLCYRWISGKHLLRGSCQIVNG